MKKNVIRDKKIWGALLLCFLLSISLITPQSVFRKIASSDVTIEELQEEITNRMSRVEEFRKIRELAKKYNVNEVYLFGGTASAWAHYVQWDMKRERGINDLQPERFDYDYTSIFRSNQDIDIVIDGPPEIAEAIEQEMKETFPFFQGKQSVWEVRLLNDARGEKDAILDNPDFLNQHSDSHSTGLIEIFGDGKKTVIDVKEVDAKIPKFLNDVHTNKLHYYYYPKLHKTTKRYIEGNNPDIFSVVRYLTKAFQYELEIEPESMAYIKKVIDEFDPTRLNLDQPYISYWLEKNAPKLFQNATNIEYAWDTLEKLGLRKKLIQVSGNPQEKESLAWWMSKEPLRSFPVGEGRGKTARELGLDVVAHETKTFDAYESITKSHLGSPNAFTSRISGEGEEAVFGEGFYTLKGTKGGRGTGITIRFHLDPNAREGVDFVVPESLDDVIVIKNKNALKVIPESMQISPVEYFKRLARGEVLFADSDKAIHEKVKRKVINRLTQISDEEAFEIYQIVKSSGKIDWDFYSVWFSSPRSLKYPELFLELLREEKITYRALDILKSNSKWLENTKYLEEFCKSLYSNPREIVEFIASQPFDKKFLPSLKLLIEREIASKEVFDFITKLEINDDTIDLYKMVVSTHKITSDVIDHIASLPYDKKNYEVVLSMFSTTQYYVPIVEKILSKPEWGKHPELVEAIILYGDRHAKDALARYVFSQKEWAKHPDLLKLLVEKGSGSARAIIEHVFSKEHWSDQLPLIEYFIRNSSENERILKFVLSKPFASKYPELVELLIERGKADLLIAQYVLSLPESANHPEWIERILERNDYQVNRYIQDYILPLEHWQKKRMTGTCFDLMNVFIK